jgi:hypothetical protein
MTEVQLLKFVNLYIEWFAFGGFVAGSLAYRNYKQLWPITAVLLLTFCNNHFAAYGAKYYHSNVELYHFYNPVEFIFLGLFFYKNFKDTLFKKCIQYFPGKASYLPNKFFNSRKFAAHHCCHCLVHRTHRYARKREDI